MSVAFAPDGKTLVSGDLYGLTALWAIDRDRWLDLACRMAGRNLTPAESETLLGTKPVTTACPGMPVPDAADISAAGSGLP